MLIKQIFAAVLAFLAGAGVSAGTFAFILVIGVVPRILQRCKVNNIILIENIIILPTKTSLSAKFLSPKSLTVSAANSIR